MVSVDVKHIVYLCLSCVCEKQICHKLLLLISFCQTHLVTAGSRLGCHGRVTKSSPVTCPDLAPGQYYVRCPISLSISQPCSLRMINSGSQSTHIYNDYKYMCLPRLCPSAVSMPQCPQSPHFAVHSFTVDQGTCVFSY